MKWLWTQSHHSGHHFTTTVTASVNVNVKYGEYQLSKCSRSIFTFTEYFHVHGVMHDGIIFLFYSTLKFCQLNRIMVCFVFEMSHFDCGISSLNGVIQSKMLFCLKKEDCWDRVTQLIVKCFTWDRMSLLILKKFFFLKLVEIHLDNSFSSVFKWDRMRPN